MVSREIAGENVKKTFEDLKESREVEAERLKDFSAACCVAHEVGWSDEELKALIDNGFSRPRIQQFRAFHSACQSKLEAEEAT